MLKTKPLLPHDKPVYREIIPQALKTAWKNPWLWIFGIFAAILNTGGSLDVVWKFWNAIQTQGADLALNNAAGNIWSATQVIRSGINWLSVSQGLVALLFFLVILLVFLAASCISQGALVYNLGGMKLLRKNSFLQVLGLGARAIIPIAVLDVLVLAAMWVARFAISFPLSLALGKHSVAFLILYVLVFVIFFVVAVGISIMQIYALNAMILQGASLAQAIGRAWEILKEHWLVSLETAVLQAFMAFLIGAVAAVAGLILSIPFVALYVSAILNSNQLLFNLTVGGFFAVTVIYLLFVLGFMVTFQYSIWTQMFRKFGEGGVVPKLHRLFRSISGRTQVPQL